MNQSKFPVFESLISKKMNIFTEKQLNNRWDFLDFYEAYSLAISTMEIKDLEIIRKFKTANYFSNTSLLDAFRTTQKGSLNEIDYLKKLKIKTQIFRGKAILKLHRYMEDDLKIINMFLSDFDDEKQTEETMEGSAGKFIIGVLEDELEI